MKSATRAIALSVGIFLGGAGCGDDDDAADAGGGAVDAAAPVVDAAAVDAPPGDAGGGAVCGNGVCEPTETAVACPDECGAIQVEAGRHHACAVLADKTLRCWGSADGHWLGGAGDLLRPTLVPGLTGVEEVACGDAHTCVRLDDGTVRCWGRNGFGQVGEAPSYVVYPPVESPIADVATIAAGSNHMCVATNAGDVRCWGRSDYFQTGLRDRLRTDATEAPLVTTGVTQLNMGNNHSCAVGASIRCWGYNFYHQLGFVAGALPGYGIRDWSPVPQTVPLTSWNARVFGGGGHTCAIVHASMGSIPSRLVCWGANGSGQLGIGTKGAASLTFQTVLDSDAGVQTAALGSNHTCAAVGPRIGLSVDPEVKCWGNNARGQLGTGDTDERLTPTSTLVQEQVIDLAVGARFTCAVLDDYTVRCWGENGAGQLGDGTRDDRLSPVEPEGL